MISEEEVQHIIKLARLDLKKKEIKKMRKELSKILDYIEKLKEVDVKDVEPMKHFVGVENVMRDDEEKLLDSNAISPQKLLALAPEIKNDYLKVKSIFQ